MSRESKNIILTIDYEIFYGKITGSVADCMIKPTKKLIEICEIHGGTMTVFWDILHYYKLGQIESKSAQVKQDIKEIETQIKELVTKGHDIQLHIHPHWLDSELENSKWNFNYDRFGLHDLIEENDPSNINSIEGCIKLSKDLLERTIRKYDPNYKARTIRAGGYLIEPFDKLSGILAKYKIKIDSSVCPNTYNENDKFSYDFRRYPKLLHYRFNSSPSTIEEKGEFIEVPVKTIDVSIMRNLYFKILKKVKYKGIEGFRKGVGSGTTTNKRYSDKLSDKIRRIVIPSYYQLTSDSCFKEKYDYLIKRASNNSVKIMHPKLLSPHMEKVIRNKVKKKEIRFVSIEKYVSELSQL